MSGRNQSYVWAEMVPFQLFFRQEMRKHGSPVEANLSQLFVNGQVRHFCVVHNVTERDQVCWVLYAGIHDATGHASHDFRHVLLCMIIGLEDRLSIFICKVIEVKSESDYGSPVLFPVHTTYFRISMYLVHGPKPD